MDKYTLLAVPKDLRRELTVVCIRDAVYDIQMIRYCLTIFVSAFLLFQIQPIVARFILPWFGGTAAVWTTCIMFFQTVLLLGYLYAHWLRRTFKPAHAWTIHILILALSAMLISVAPADTYKPTGGESLTGGIVKVLTFSIGLPFFVLSSTGPLIQAWQSTTHQQQSPYRLYALSNLGSMLALLTYPFLVERIFPLADQAFIWTIGFLLFVILCFWSGWQTLKFENWSSLNGLPESVSSGVTKSGPANAVFWTGLAMGASVMLLATTNLMCQEVASVPFLWILPLMLYLLSFIICFDRPAFYRRELFTPLLIIGTIISIGLVHLDVLAGFGLQIGGLAFVCFVASMTCHGELERLKPETKDLTSFYLWISVGGALGGVFVCIIAPHLFDGFYEFHVGLIIALLVALVAILRSNSSVLELGLKKLYGWTMAMGVFVAMGTVCCSLIYFLDPSYHEGLIFRDRNEYGLASVLDDGPYRKFINGRIDHGMQLNIPGREMERVGYYIQSSGVGVGIRSYREFHSSPLNIGVVGLGAGAMATWLEPDDKMVFYEINPMVEEIARQHFKFLESSEAEINVVLGDGRIQLQNRLNQFGSAEFDLLIMDAFASDSIPVHLLTRECFDLYFKHLKRDGILIAHITNRFIDLRPVLMQHAKKYGIEPVLIDSQSDDGLVETRWVLLTQNQNVLNSEIVNRAKHEWPPDLIPMSWTDDFASLAALLNWSSGVDWEKIQSSRQKTKPENASKPK